MILVCEIFRKEGVLENFIGWETWLVKSNFWTLIILNFIYLANLWNLELGAGNVVGYARGQNVD